MLLDYCSGRYDDLSHSSNVNIQPPIERQDKEPFS